MTSKTPLTLILLSILGLIIVCMMSSCSTRRLPNTSTPSKREIKKAMRYSTSSYINPTVPSSTGTVSQSNYHFHTNQ